MKKAESKLSLWAFKGIHICPHLGSAHVTMIQQPSAEAVPEDITCHVLFHAVQRNFES